MKCPACSTVLQLAERQGVEIDYCPACRGVWLDRGEVDKLIERAAAAEVALGRSAAAPVPTRRPSDDDRYEPRRDRDRYERERRYDDDDDDYRKRKSFLRDIFDFG